MIDIVMPDEFWCTAEDFSSAIDKIKANVKDYDHDQKFVLIDWETKQTMFLKVKHSLEQY